MPKVLIYSTPTCHFCKLTKEFLKEKGIPYEEINVAGDQARAQEMIEKSGQMGVPVIDIEGKIIIGFDKQALKKALNLSYPL